MMLIRMAWKNIWRNPTRSLVILLSVATGLFAGIAVLALYKGMMQNRVRTVIHEETGHIQVHQKGFTAEMDPALFIEQPMKMLQELQRDSGIVAISSRTVATGMISNARGSSGINILGIDPRSEDAVSNLSEKIREGVWDLKDDQKGILVGRKLAKKMGLSLGKKVVITLTDTTDEMIASAFRIKGIYQSSNVPLDEITVYITDTALQQMLSMPGSKHEISLLLKQDDGLLPTLTKLRNEYPSLAIESWKDLSPETTLMVNTMDYYSYIILIIILIALSFGIMNTMMMAVLERKKEISRMMALGMSSQQLLLMILTETVFLTIIGIPLALTLSYLTIRHYAKTGIDMSGLREEMMQSFGFSTTIYPSFPTEKIFPILLLVLITAILSSIVPMMKTSQINTSTALQ
jgi:ABC-type lipoprotein release transport system permease subunit